MRHLYNTKPPKENQTSSASSKKPKTNEELVQPATNPYAGDKNKLPEPPSTCCMSACPNCVWLIYAEALTKFVNDSGEGAIRTISENVQDPNMRAYILHEMRMRKRIS